MLKSNACVPTCSHVTILSTNRPTKISSCPSALPAVLRFSSVKNCSDCLPSFCLVHKTSGDLCKYRNWNVNVDCFSDFTITDWRHGIIAKGLWHKATTVLYMMDINNKLFNALCRASKHKMKFLLPKLIHV